ncbi:MAG: hypothetical protein LH645_02715 [Actinomycetia bacterium]|nr:hypothetical protein [Actinomycetes bacterium]
MPDRGGVRARWIHEHPAAKDSPKELYGGSLRTCVGPDLGRTELADMTQAVTGQASRPPQAELNGL